MTKELNEANLLLTKAHEEFKAKEYNAAEPLYAKAIDGYQALDGALRATDAVAANLSTAYANLSTCFVEQKQFVEAAACLDKAINADIVTFKNAANADEKFADRKVVIWNLYGKDVLDNGDEAALIALLQKDDVTLVELKISACTKLMGVLADHAQRVQVLESVVKLDKGQHDKHFKYFKSLLAVEYAILGKDAELKALSVDSGIVRDAALYLFAKNKNEGAQALLTLRQNGDEDSKAALVTIAHNHAHDDIDARILGADVVMVHEIL